MGTGEVNPSNWITLAPCRQIQAAKSDPSRILSE